MNQVPVEFHEVRCTRETDAALLCVIDGANVWLPRSMILSDSEINSAGDIGTLVISEWLANEKGLI